MDRNSWLNNKSHYLVGLGFGASISSLFVAGSYGKFNTTTWIFVAAGIVSILIGGAMGSLANRKKQKPEA